MIDSRSLLPLLGLGTLAIACVGYLEEVSDHRANAVGLEIAETDAPPIGNPLMIQPLSVDMHDSESITAQIPRLPDGITYEQTTDPPEPVSSTRISAEPAPEEPFVIAAAGDIACAPGSTEMCGSAHTASLLDGVDLVLGLGDMQYESATMSSFMDVYDQTWGEYKDITYPVVGNHEYYSDSEASGFFEYFDHIDSDRYSFTENGWKFIAVNSNCSYNGGCKDGSPQVQWLETELQNSPECTIAYWHHPRFSSGVHGDDRTMQPAWDLMQEYGGDIVLSGHDHNYERFTPIGGVRQFVSGLGGKNTRGVGSPHAGSEFIYNDALGVLFLYLYDGYYEWEFVNVAGEVIDSGQTDCNSAGSLPEGKCSQWYQTALDAGWEYDQLTKLGRIMWAESNCIHDIANKTYSYGLVQMEWSAHNDWLASEFGVTTPEELYDPYTNLLVARWLFDYASSAYGCGWQPWYMSGDWC